MECIDFDGYFAEFVSDWVDQHTEDYRNADEMEADMPRIYTRFLNTPATWLDGFTPGSYFTQFEDPKELVDWLQAYCEQAISVPEVLLEQIQNVGKPCEKRLVALLKDEEADEDARMTAVGMLGDIGSEQPKLLYIQWQLNREEQDELADNAIDSLAEMGKAVVQPILELLPKANQAGQVALLDVLVRHPGDDRIYRLAERLFRENPQGRALFASYLGKLGDERALPVLLEAANDPRTGYIDYIELRSAIEALGGEAPEREFEDDPAYEALGALNPEGVPMEVWMPKR